MVLKEITERQTVRNYSDKELSDEVLGKILESARLAPSWMNIQSWHFIVVKDERNKSLLSQLSHGQPHVEKAPAVIICCGEKDFWEEEIYRKNIETKKGITQEKINMMMKNPALNPKLLGKDAVITRSLEQLTYAIAYMTIEAEANGVGACVIGAIGNEFTGSVPEVYELARKTFEIPENTEIMALLTLGYPSEDIQKLEKNRKSFDDVVSWGFYGNKKH